MAALSSSRSATSLSNPSPEPEGREKAASESSGLVQRSDRIEVSIKEVFGCYNAGETRPVMKPPIRPRAFANFPIQRELDSWVDAHPDNVRKIARIAAKCIKYVPHKEFGVRLSHTLDHMCRQISLNRKGLFDPSKEAFVLVEPNKSNKWVADLARHDCGFDAARYYRLGEKDAREFSQYVSTLTKETILEDFRGKSIILFDDGSYSGAQMVAHVRAVIEAIQKYRLPVQSIGIAIPYMTRHAYEALQRIKEQSPIPIFIGQPEIIRSLKEMDATFGIGDQLCAMWQLNRDDLAKLGLYLFDHKVPNYQSFPLDLAKGKVRDLDGRHVVRGRNDFVTVPFFREEPPPYKAD